MKAFKEFLILVAKVWLLLAVVVTIGLSLASLLPKKSLFDGEPTRAMPL